MSKEGIWLETSTGTEFVPYEELDSDEIKKLLRPISGFVYPADRYMELPLPKIPFYIKDWLPRQGRLLLFAPAKSGKSFAALQMARCIGCGAPFLEIPVTQGRVLYLQHELGARVLQGRMQDTGRKYPNVYVGSTFSLKIDEPSGQRVVMDLLEAIEPEVLIFDPLYKVMSGEENSVTDMRRVTDFIDDAIQAYKCSVILIHHPGKDIAKGSRGSSHLNDWPDTVVRMKKVSKPEEKLRNKFRPIMMRHAELPPEEIEGEMHNFEFQRLGDEPTVRQRVETVTKNAWEQGGSAVRSRNLFEVLGIGSRTSVADAFNGLVAEKKVTKIKNGEYVWNPPRA